MRIQTQRLVLRPVDNRPYFLGIFRGREVIGAVEADLGTGSLRYAVGEPHRGRGYATEAAGALARVVFARRLAARLEVRCAASNRAAARVAERLGARLEEGEDGLLAGALDEETLRAAGTIEVKDDSGRYLVGESDASLAETWSSLQAALDERFGDACPAHVVLVEAASEPAVEMRVFVGDEGALPPSQVLRHNATLAVGALCHIDGELVLRHVAPLPSLRVAWAVRAVELLAHEAHRLGRLVPRPAEPTMFAVFAE